MEYGPTQGSLTAANADVRQCLSDMGTEFGIANYVDVVPHYLGQGSARAANACPGQFLYPLAMQVPGVLHIVDWVIRTGIERLTFYPKWQSSAKLVLQMLHSQKLRQHMCALLHAMDIDRVRSERLASSLASATGKFANWRWRTLWDAVRDLLRIEDAVRTLLGSASNPSKELAIRAQGRADSLKEAVDDPLFWEQARVIQTILKPLMRFSSWIQGCQCHEAEQLQGKRVECKLKGCRAPFVAAKVDSVLDELQGVRNSLHPGQFGDVALTGVFGAVAERIAGVALKMQWAHQLPYLIWQAIRQNLFPRANWDNAMILA